MCPAPPQNAVATCASGSAASPATAGSRSATPYSCIPDADHDERSSSSRRAEADTTCSATAPCGQHRYRPQCRPRQRQDDRLPRRRYRTPRAFPLQRSANITLAGRVDVFGRQLDHLQQRVERLFGHCRIFRLYLGHHGDRTERGPCDTLTIENSTTARRVADRITAFSHGRHLSLNSVAVDVAGWWDAVRRSASSERRPCACEVRPRVSDGRRNRQAAGFDWSIPDRRRARNLLPLQGFISAGQQRALPGSIWIERRTGFPPRDAGEPFSDRAGTSPAPPGATTGCSHGDDHRVAKLRTLPTPAARNRRRAALSDVEVAGALPVRLALAAAQASASLRGMRSVSSLGFCDDHDGAGRSRKRRQGSERQWSAGSTPVVPGVQTATACGVKERFLVVCSCHRPPKRWPERDELDRRQTGGERRPGRRGRWGRLALLRDVRLRTDSGAAPTCNSGSRRRDRAEAREAQTGRSGVCTHLTRREPGATVLPMPADAPLHAALAWLRTQPDVRYAEVRARRRRRRAPARARRAARAGDRRGVARRRHPRARRKTWGFACTADTSEGAPRSPPPRRALADRARLGRRRPRAGPLPRAAGRSAAPTRRRVAIDPFTDLHSRTSSPLLDAPVRALCARATRASRAPRRGWTGRASTSASSRPRAPTSTQTFTYGACGMHVFAVGDDGVSQRRSYPTWQGGDGFQAG